MGITTPHQLRQSSAQRDYFALVHSPEKAVGWKPVIRFFANVRLYEISETYLKTGYLELST